VILNQNFFFSEREKMTTELEKQKSIEILFGEIDL